MRQEIQDKIQQSSETQVTLSGMNILDNEVEEIARLVKETRPGLSRIFLDDNQITDSGAMILGNEFSTLRELLFIDIQFNKVDINGATALLSLRKNNPGLRIALRGNKIKNAVEMNKISCNQDKL